MNTDEKKPNGLKKQEQSIAEQAINEKETDGRKINHQVEKRREKHQPRDTA